MAGKYFLKLSEVPNKCAKKDFELTFNGQYNTDCAFQIAMYVPAIAAVLLPVVEKYRIILRPKLMPNSLLSAIAGHHQRRR